MNAHHTRHRTSGFNLIELLVIIGAIAFLAAMVIGALLSAHHKMGRILCVRNLKEIGVALRSEGGQDPMQVVLTNNETMKLVTNGSAYLLWQSLSNHLRSPNALHCFDDDNRPRKAALSFSQGFSNDNISYFFNLDAPATYPQLILSGDRNVWVDGLAAQPGLQTVTTNSVIGWTQDQHVRVGNLLMADGSCMQVTSNGLKMAFAEAFTASTNITSARLVIP